MGVKENPENQEFIEFLLRVGLDPEFVTGRAILTTLNEHVNELNAIATNMLLGKLTIRKALDTILNANSHDAE
ncbi:hypothetical protein BGX26_010438 [Mortierella sp. AD094]|nr:hypothetical protein BGX26_010438 [Mortierella sp. AD094]